MAAMSGQPMGVIAFFSGDVRDPKVHVRRIRVPVDDHTQISLHRLEKGRVQSPGIQLHSRRPAPGNEPVQFHQHNLLHAGEAAGHRAFQHLPVHIQRLLGFPQFIQHQRQIPVGLGFFRKQRFYGFKNEPGLPEFFHVTQLVAQHAQQGTVFQFQLRQVGQNLDSQRLVPLPGKPVRAVHVKTGAVPILFLEFHIDRKRAVSRIQSRQIRSLGVPRLHVHDGGRTGIPFPRL